MSKKKNIIILVLVFVLLIGGASVLYTQLSKDDAPDGLLVQGDQNKNDNESQSDSSGTGDTERQLTKAPISLFMMDREARSICRIMSVSRSC